ncbi:hypothetical protein ACOJTA_05645 [Malaciobacter sp. WC5094]
MSAYKLNIPTVISHSNFILDGEVAHIKERELNYFYSLLYLFRKNIQKQSGITIFLKEENTTVLNPQFKNLKVKIELLEFYDICVVNNYSYSDLKVFIELLSQIKIKTNILKKNKSHNLQTIDIIETYSIDKDNILHLNLTDAFLDLFLHTEKYFMGVDLNLLFKINGYKAKRLYLTIKDYANYKNKCIVISKENLQSLIGKIPSKKIFEDTIDNLNKIEGMDMKFEYPILNGKKLKEYRFEYKKVKKTTLKSKSTKLKEEINIKVMDEAKQKVDEQIKKGKNIENEDAYVNTIYKNEMKKIEANKPKEKSKTDLEVEELIQSEISKLKEKENIQYQYNNYLILKKRNIDYFIDDDFIIFEQRDYEKKNPKTKSSEEVLNYIDLYSEELTFGVYCANGNGGEIQNMTISKIEKC